MGYELKQLMKMYGVSTPTMAPAPQMPGAAPIAPTAPVLAENATKAQRKQYDKDLKAYNTSKEQYEKDKAAFDETMRKYGLDKAQYDQYSQDYQNRLANTNLYNQAQFSTTGANVPPITTFSDAQKAAVGMMPATDQVGGPQDFANIGQGGLNQQIQSYMSTSPSAPDMNAFMTRYGLTDYDMRNAMGTGTTYGAPQWTDMLKPPVYASTMTTTPVNPPVATTVPGAINTGTMQSGGVGRDRDSGDRVINRTPSGTGTGTFFGYTGLRDMFDGGGPGQSGQRGGYTGLRDMFDGGGPGRSRAKAAGGYIQNYAEGGTVRGYQRGGPLSTISGGAGDDVLMGRPAGDMLTPEPAPVVEDPQDAMMAMLARYAAPVDRSAEIAAASERRAAEQKAFEELLMRQLDAQDSTPESKAEMYLRLAAAFGAPTKTGHFSENLALAGQTMADQLAEKSKREREARATRLGVQTELQKMRMDAAREEESALRGMQEGEMEYARDLYKESLKGSEGKFRRATKEEAAAYGAEGGQFGPDGRFYAIDVPQGMAIESDGQGGFRLIQGPGAGKSDKPPTEGQLAGAGYLQRMTKAEAILRDLERTENVVTIPLEKTLLMGTGAEGYVLNSVEQRVAQAQRDWVRAKLRKESGAVIGAEEMAEEIKTYFPQPGEGPETIAQKADARRSAERQMQIGSGSAAEQAGEISPEYAPPIRADDLARAGIGGGPAPQPVVIDGVTIRKVN